MKRFGSADGHDITLLGLFQPEAGVQATGSTS